MQINNLYYATVIKNQQTLSQNKLIMTNSITMR